MQSIPKKIVFLMSAAVPGAGAAVDRAEIAEQQRVMAESQAKQKPTDDKLNAQMKPAIAQTQAL